MNAALQTDNRDRGVVGPRAVQAGAGAKAHAITPMALFSRATPACSFTLPLPPSTNRLWEPTRKGMRRTDAYNAWLDFAAVELRRQQIAPVKGHVIALLGFERPSEDSDCDNRLKATQDAIEKAGIIENDNKIVSPVPFWLPKANGLAHIQIFPIQAMCLQFHPAMNGTSGSWVSVPFQEQGEDDGYFIG